MGRRTRIKASNWHRWLVILRASAEKPSPYAGLSVQRLRQVATSGRMVEKRRSCHRLLTQWTLAGAKPKRSGERISPAEHSGSDLHLLVAPVGCRWCAPPPAVAPESCSEGASLCEPDAQSSAIHFRRRCRHPGGCERRRQRTAAICSFPACQGRHSTSFEALRL